MISGNLLIFGLATVALASEVLDIRSIPPIADNTMKTGNKYLFERENNNTQAQLEDDDDFMDVNEIPVRYDETQLWRIYNITKFMSKSASLADTIEHNLGGTIWKSNSKFMDISIGKDNVKKARSFLLHHDLYPEVISSNVQDLIDNEQLLGVLGTQSEKSSRLKRASRSGIHWKDYHDLDVIYSFMREIRGKFPNICRLYSIGKTVEGRDLKVLRISENPKENKKIWIDGGIHAREWISPATVTFILYQLMSNWESQPQYMKDKTWYFMPVMNPDGYTYSRKVNRLWRKNRSPSKRANCFGVDLNRNFDISWNGFGSSTNPCSDTFRGTTASSELETQAVVQFLTKRKHNLAAYLTFHSYGQMVVYPWAYKATKVKDAPMLQRVGNTAVQRIEQKTGAIYRAAVTHELLGIAGGGSDDWSRAALGAKYVYTVELRDTGKFGFILPADQILDTAIEGYIVTETVAQAIV